MPPPQRAQERAHRRRRGHPVPEHRLPSAGPQRVDIVDAVSAGQRRMDHRRALLARVGPAGQPLIEQVGQAQPLPEQRRQQQAGVGDQRRVVRGHTDTAEVMPCSHQEGAPDSCDDLGLVTVIVQLRSTLFSLPHRSPTPNRWIQAKATKREVDAVGARGDVVYAGDQVRAFLTASAMSNVATLVGAAEQFMQVAPGGQQYYELLINAYGMGAAQAIARFQ